MAAACTRSIAPVILSGKMRKTILINALASVMVLSSAPVAQTIAPEAGTAVFWRDLQKLCGNAYRGVVAAAPADDTTFKDKELVMHVRSCEPNRMRIPFMVGTDRSRTWVLTRNGNRLQLKHDHRHEDGQPDKTTNYGGWTTNTGMPTRQVFPADQETVDIIPAAGPNVWWIELAPGESFSYNLRRMGSERYFSIRFDLKNPVKAPQAPWGWRD